MIRLTAFAALAISLLASPLAAENRIADRATLEQDVRILADDAMEGREAGTPGYDRAADYVAGRFADIGLQPGGDDQTWFQHFPLVRHSQASDSRLAIIDAHGRATKASFGEDFVGGGLASAGGPDGRGDVEAPIVFVGYGLEMAELGHDSFADVDLDGKIAMWVFSMPDDIDPLLAIHLQQAGADRFAAQGAIGSILLWTPELDGRSPWLSGRSYVGDIGGLTWIGPDDVPFDRAGDMQFQLIASPELSRSLMEGQQFGWDDITVAQLGGMMPMPSFDTGMSARVSYASAFEPVLETSNVIGIQQGTDPSLAEQYVVVTAHLDHVGVSNNSRPDGDMIFNGAMDNASGVATMLEMARLLIADPPRRPVMFVSLGAEEKGLLGSSYHAANPGLEHGELAVNVNVDMPILTWPFNDIVAFGADRSNIWGAVGSAASAYNVKLVPDPNPDEAFFFRSDQYSYVRQGIPAAYLDLGFGNGGDVAQTAFLDRDYHQPSDEPDGIDYEQLGRFADIAYLVARNVADMDERPAWLPGDFFGSTFGGPIAGDR